MVPAVACGGRWAEMGPGSTTPVTQVPPAHLAFSAARGVKWVQPTSVPRPAGHTGDRTRELTWVLLSLQCPGLPGGLPKAVTWPLMGCAGPNRDRKVPGPAQRWKPSHRLLCEPTAPGGGTDELSHHPPSNPCAGRCQMSSQNKPAWTSAPGGQSRADTVDGPGGAQRGPLRAGSRGW